MLEGLPNEQLKEHATLRITAHHRCYRYLTEPKSSESGEISYADLEQVTSSFCHDDAHTIENPLTQGGIRGCDRHRVHNNIQTGDM
jgi:hypothetical protein